MPGKDKSIETESGLVVARGWRETAMDTCDLWEVMDMF